MGRTNGAPSVPVDLLNISTFTGLNEGLFLHTHTILINHIIFNAPIMSVILTNFAEEKCGSYAVKPCYV